MPIDWDNSNDHVNILEQDTIDYKNLNSSGSQSIVEVLNHTEISETNPSNSANGKSTLST